MKDTKVEIIFSEDDIKYLQTKFDIKTEKDLIDVVWECLNTYMEM